MANCNTWLRRRTLKILVAINCFVIANAKLLSKLQDTIVLVGDSANFNCRSNVSSEIHWHHNDEFIYAGGRFYKLYGERFRMNKTTGTYNLSISNARPNDAGVYKCSEDEGRGESSSANLIVLDSPLFCKSNMKPDGYIGPNTCNLQPENMRFTCSVTFNGISPPRLIWCSRNDSRPHNGSVCEYQPNRINCSLTLRSDPQFDGSVFICQTTAPSGKPYNCSIEAVKIQYFEHNLRPVEKQIGDEITCAVRSNQVLRFNWKLLQDNQEILLSNSQSHVIRGSGMHLCHAFCDIRDVTCSALVAVVYAQSSEEKNSTQPKASAAAQQVQESNKALNSVLSALALVTIVLLVVTIFYIIHLKRIQNKNCLQRELELEQKLFQRRKETVKYKKEPELKHTIKTKAGQELKEPIYGVAILGDELFTISRNRPEFEVYSLLTEEFSYIASRAVQDLETPRNIVSCTTNNCLYIENVNDSYDLCHIIRVNRIGTIEKQWRINGNVGRMSVTSESNVMLTHWNGSKLLEYTCDGNAVREIDIFIEPRPQSLRHVILLKSGYFVLIQGDNANEEHKISIIGSHGKLVKAFGGKPGPSNTQVNCPSYLLTDEDDSILVADRRNDRVILLDSQLEFKRTLLSTKHGLVNPWRICLDMQRGLLLVVDNEFLPQDDKFEGRVFVFSVIDQNATDK